MFSWLGAWFASHPILAVITLVAFTSWAPVHAIEPCSPPKIFQEILSNGLAVNGVAPSITQSMINREDISRMVNTNLSPRLMSGVQSKFGKSFSIVQIDNTDILHAGVIALEYPTNNLAAQQKNELSSLSGYFSKTKILIRFTAVQVGRYLIISYSKSSGNQRMVDIIAEVPGKLEKVACSWDN